MRKRRVSTFGSSSARISFGRVQNMRLNSGGGGGCGGGGGGGKKALIKSLKM